MATWTNITKNTATWLPLKKNVFPGGSAESRFGAARFGSGRFGKVTLPTWTNQTKNAATWTNITKN